MAVYPEADWLPLPENKTEPKIVVQTMIFHSAAVNVSSLWQAFNRDGNPIESHFFVKWTGKVEQYMDTDRQADANRYASDFAISVETEDDGDPNNQPWSNAQIVAMVKLFNWALSVHPHMVRRECPTWDRAGFGYHTMWGSPSPWTPVAKSCPGTVRIKQYKENLRPLLLTASSVKKVPEMVIYNPANEDVMYLYVDRELVALDGPTYAGHKAAGIPEVPCSGEFLVNFRKALA